MLCTKVVKVETTHTNKSRQKKMVLAYIPAHTFRSIGENIIWRYNSNRRGRLSIVRRFRVFFGTSSGNVSRVWTLIVNYMDDDDRKFMEPKHLLWGLMFLKLYDPLEVLASIASTNRKTYSKWSWRVVEMISDLQYDIIKLENRFKDDIGNVAKMVIDGVDFRVLEVRNQKGKFDTKMFSHKFKAGGLKYEIGSCIRTGWIVWINGPIYAGKPDWIVFRDGLMNLLDDGEKVHADRGYKFRPVRGSCFLGHPDRIYTINSQIRAIHEGLNRRFRTWQCLYRTWRHNAAMHEVVFSAVAVLTQIAIQNDEPVMGAVSNYDEDLDLMPTDIAGYYSD